MKAILRGVALRVPRIRRLYDFAMQEARENRERAATIAALIVEHAAAVAEMTTGVKSPLLSKEDSTPGSRNRMRSNLEYWKELQERDYFETHLCYNGLIDMGDAECDMIE